MSGEAILRGVGLILLLASIAGIVVALRVLRRELPVRPKYDAIRLAIALGSALLITAVLSIGTPGWLVAGGLGLGLILGVFQGRAMKIRVASDGVFATRTMASIVTWGAGMVLAQGAGIANRVGFAAIGLAVAYFSAGMAGGLIVGRNQAIETARQASAGVAVAAIAFALAAAPLFSFTAPAHAQAAGEFELSISISSSDTGEQATTSATYSGTVEAVGGELVGNGEGTIDDSALCGDTGNISSGGSFTFDVVGAPGTDDIEGSVFEIEVIGTGLGNTFINVDPPNAECEAQTQAVLDAIGTGSLTFTIEDADGATTDVSATLGGAAYSGEASIEEVAPPTTTTLPPTTRPTIPDDPEDDSFEDDTLEDDSFGDDVSSGFDGGDDPIDLGAVDDLDGEIADALSLSSDAEPGEAAGAALVGVAGVVGLLGSTLSEAGMSGGDALRARRRDDDWPPDPPDDPGGAPPPPPPPPSAPDTAADTAVMEPPPAPEPESVTLEFRTSDVSSDVAADVIPDTPPPPPPVPSVEVAPEVTPDAPPPPPAPVTSGPAADIPTAPPPDVDSATRTAGSALREALRATGTEAPPGSGLGTLLNDVAPSGPGLNLAAEEADAGIGPAVDRVTLALADRASLTPATISIDEAVIASGASPPTNSFDPLAGIDPAAGEFASDPAAFARSLLGDAGMEALGDTSRPLGESVGSRLFPIDVGATEADSLTAPTGPPPTDPPPVGDTTELMGDIAEDSAEVVGDVVEDRGLGGAQRAAATRSGQSTDRDRDADPNSGWTTHELSPALREQLGLPDLPLPIRADQAAAVLGNPIDLPGLVGEIDAYLRAHPWAQRSYGDTIALLAHVGGVARGRASDHATALSLFSTGLDYSPDNISLQANQALALHCLGRHHEAAAAYESLLATPGVRRRSLLGLVAARAYTDAGDENAVRALLEEITAGP